MGCIYEYYLIRDSSASHHQSTSVCRIWGFHSRGYEEFCLLGRFREIYHLHLQGRRINRAKYQRESRWQRPL
jgi:hypothetical protein